MSDYFCLTERGNLFDTKHANESQWMMQRVTTSITKSNNEWYNEWQGGTTSDNKWQIVVISANFPFFQIREELSHSL